MGNTIKFLRIVISAFMLIICTHPAFSLAVLSCTAYTSQDTCEASLLCKWENGECTKKVCTCTSECSSGDYCFYNELTDSCSCQQCLNGYYCPGGQQAKQCPRNYPNSAKGSTKIEDCYLLTLQPGYMLQNKKAVDCKAGGFCPYTTPIPYKEDGHNLADTWGWASCESGVPGKIYFNGQGDREVGSDTKSDDAADCYAKCENKSIDNGSIKPDKTEVNAKTINGISYTYDPCTYTNIANVICDTGYKKKDTTSCDLIQYSIKYNKNHYATTCGYKKNGMGLITYYNGDCPESYKSEAIDYDKEFSLEQKYIITGYAFDKWYKNSDCTGTGYSATQTVSGLTTKHGDTVNLYACWTANEYEVEFIGNGATSGTMSNQTLTYDASQTLSENTFTRTGYTFKSWNTMQDGSGTSYNDKHSKPNIVGSGTIKLYAQWKPAEIEFNLKPASIKIGDKTMALTYQKNPVPSKIKVTYGQNVFYGQSSNTGWVELTKFKNAYKIDNIPIVSGTVFKGYVKKGNTSATELINENGSFLSGFSSTTFSSQTDVTNNFYPKFASCQCRGEHWTECNVVGTDDTNKCQYQTKCDTGYSIGGGSDDTQGVGTNYYNWTASGTNASNTIDCKPRTFDFTFRANGGSVTNESRTGVEYNSVPYDLTANETPQRTGYTFYGYSTAKLYKDPLYFNAAGEFVYNSENGNRWQQTSNPYMYAQWDAKTYTVTLNNQGADSAGTASVTATYDSVLPAITDIPQKTGRDFGGYFSDMNCNGTKYINANGSATSTTWTTDGGATLYACWIPDAITIELDENGADTFFLDDSQKKLTLIYGVNYFPFGTTYEQSEKTSPVTQLDPIPIKTTSVFTGFYYGNTQVYNKNGALNDGMTQLVLSNSTFTAVYDACTCTAGNHSTCGVDLTTEDNKCQYLITCASGYHVNGKGNNVLNDSVTGEAGESAYTSDACIARTFTVTLNDDYGTGGPASITVTYDKKPDNILTLPTRTGYTFLGYFDANDGEGGTQYFNANGEFVKGEKWNKVGSEELYANWQANTYTVTLDNDGADSATPGTASVTATFDSDMPGITPPQKTGHTFQGYYTEKNGGGTPYYGADGTSANIWNIAKDETLYAKWSVNAYTVSFDRNCDDGGDGTMAAQTGREYGDKTALPKNVFTCGHLVFIGWNTAKDGSGDSFDDESTKDITTGTGTVRLYAQWLGCAAGCYCPQGEDIKGCDDVSGGQKCCVECPNLFTSNVGSTEIYDCYLTGKITLTDEMGFAVDYDIINHDTGEDKLYWNGPTKDKKE